MTETTVPSVVQAELERIRNPHNRQVIAYLAGQSGVRGATGLWYLVARMRWHLGDRRTLPIAKSLNTRDTAHVERRAGELLEAHHHLLPPLVNAPRHGEAPAELDAGAGIPTATPDNVVPIGAARRSSLPPRRPGGHAA